MENQISLPFNPKSPTVMHIDLNSCFASIEQQANPFLRGKPIAVAAYDTPRGCIIAPSIEAKKLGIKVGMRVRDGKLLCPNLIIKTPDPGKYRNVHLRLKTLLSSYTDKVTPKSIDEFVLDLEGYPAYEKGMKTVGEEMKQHIREEIGEWIRVSIGISTNRFLAKTAAGLKKPDGLEVIDRSNFQTIYGQLALTDLCGIKANNVSRLNGAGIYTVMDFYRAPLWKLKAAFQSILGYYWHLRLRGWEIDDVEFARGSYGNSYALPNALSTPAELAPILTKLVEKAGRRMRAAGYRCRGVHLSLLYRDRSFWHHGVSTSDCLFDSRDIYKAAFHILSSSPYRKPVSNIAVSCFLLEKAHFMQEYLFSDMDKKEKVVQALDSINSRWGDFVITPARMMSAKDDVHDRIAFGGVKELEETVVGNSF